MDAHLGLTQLTYPQTSAHSPARGREIAGRRSSVRRPGTGDTASVVVGPTMHRTKGDGIDQIDLDTAIGTWEVSFAIMCHRESCITPSP